MCIRYYYLVKQRTGKAGRKAAPQEAPQGPAGCIFISEGKPPYLLGIPWKGRRPISLTLSLWWLWKSFPILPY